jgi:hypothetical protein
MTDADALFWLRVMAIASALQVAILFAAVLAAVVLIRPRKPAWASGNVSTSRP